MFGDKIPDNGTNFGSAMYYLTYNYTSNLLGYESDDSEEGDKNRILRLLKGRDCDSDSDSDSDNENELDSSNKNELETTIENGNNIKVIGVIGLTQEKKGSHCYSRR